jgi:hypothetical protein
MQPAANHKRVYRDSAGGGHSAHRQFSDLTASELYCPRCRISRPVRERLLLVLPHAEIREYRCVVCAESLGTRELSSGNAAGGIVR